MSKDPPLEYPDFLFAIPGYDPVATAPEGFYYDHAAGQHILDFFDLFVTHAKGKLAGEPMKLQDWQKAVLANANGWKRPDGTRRYREVFWMVPRKNGKTTICAGWMLYMLSLDKEKGAELYSAAADREQASLVYDQARTMVHADEILSKKLRVVKTTKSILNEQRNSSYKALSADASTKHGFNMHFGIFDELHAQPNRDLCDVLETSMGSREEPCIVYITTSDFAGESICNEKLEIARKVRDGVIEDPALLPAIWEALPSDDWTDVEVWKKANPNFGVSISQEFLERECQKAQEIPSYRNTFKRLYLNIQTSTDEEFLSIEDWDACEELDVAELEGRPCFVGIDLASTLDISAMALVFPDDDLEGVSVLPYFFVPEDNHVRDTQYLGWHEGGYLDFTPGNVCDYAYILKKLQSLRERFDIREIGIDQWNATQFAIELQEEDFTVEFFGQGYSHMSAPTKQLEMYVASKKFRHGGHPVLRWMAANCQKEEDAAGNIKPSKKKSRNKIDGIVACCMGIGRAIQAMDTTSVYDSRGIHFL